ncbi:SRPBCC family protein [Thalassotalea euphylliae]|uniref:Polyketide cyclase n=1 Tax=Thalassotalea euphylliae TaxID=1655234 RepID=A0A3E0UDQ2_9GAMM|nr:SRPBCC family protein [Thalassotalea euphylliae]REL35026.1 polyketide cyclase [Thalassotalea euphylliae]
MLKKLILIIGAIIALPLIVALFLPNSYEVERQVIINKPKAEVFDYVKYLKNQNIYSKWAQIDPNMVKTFRGDDAQVGFVSRWESEHPDVGTGEQEIIAIQEGEKIDYELRFIKPFEATSPAYMTTEAVSSSETQVSWGFQGHLNYPMNLMFLFIDFKQVIGDDLQFGLNNLKMILES